MIVIGNVIIEYDYKNEFNGAFRYIQNLVGDNDIVSKNYVKVSVSSSNNQNPSTPVIDNTLGDTYWQSEDIENSWYEIDFVNNSFYLESYVLRMNIVDFYKEWEILGSNDGINYEVIDNQTDFAQPSGIVINKRFICKNPLTKRMFRYQPKGTRFRGDHYVTLHRIDFFGSFMSSHTHIISCLQNINHIYYPHCLFIFTLH